MNKRQKEVIQYQLDSEKAVLEQLTKQYQKALNDIDRKIRILQSDELTQSRIYRIEHQKVLKKQVEAVLEKLHADEYTTIQQFLSDSYTDAFVGTAYDMFGQGVPLILPIDRNAAVKAVTTDSKISEGLYESLGVDTKKLKKSISSEITRGIASGMPHTDIARNIARYAKVSLGRASTIVRTESHRIQQASKLDAQNAAKAKGANVVKQWNSTLDGDTRKTHRSLDGQIRELDEPFEMGGKKAMHPGGFGDPAEDCNCRCQMLQRARLALNEDELKTLQERAEFFGLDKTGDLEDFKKKYLNAVKSEKLKSDSITDEYFRRAEKALEGITAKESHADWDAVLKISKEAASDLNRIHSELNRHMIDNHTEMYSVYNVLENKSFKGETGTINEVFFSDSTRKLLKKSSENSIILVHVHPNDGSFSLEDIEPMVLNKSVRTLTLELPSGDKYVIERGSFKSGFFASSKFFDAADKAESEAMSMFKIFENDRRKELPPEKQEEFMAIWDDYVDARNRLLAEKLGMKYMKVKNDG